MQFIQNVDCAPCALIEQNDESVRQNIISELAKSDKIEFCNVAVCGSRAIIGVIPYPLFSRSQREALEREISKCAYSLYDFDDVAVSFDTDIIYALSKSDSMHKDVFDSLFESVRKRRAQ